MRIRPLPEKSDCNALPTFASRACPESRNLSLQFANLRLYRSSRYVAIDPTHKGQHDPRSPRGQRHDHKSPNSPELKACYILYGCGLVKSFPILVLSYPYPHTGSNTHYAPEADRDTYKEIPDSLARVYSTGG